MNGMKRAAERIRHATGSLGGIAARRVSVRDAWLAHERYAGRRIAITGTLRSFESSTPTEYFVLDDGPQRVGLRGDAALLRPHVGRRVRAIGALTFRPGIGIFLDAESVRLVGSPHPSAT